MNEKFIEFRRMYPDFIYDKYTVEKTEEEYKITYFFEIPNLTVFRPILKINTKYITNKNINENFFNYLVFNIGMIELISYVKCTCSKNIIIKAGYLDEDQIEFFKKLYYYGLGEFLYINKIDIDIESLFNFKVENSIKPNFDLEYNGFGNLIPIGGGKDSCVSLELLKYSYKDNTCFVINPKSANLDCIKIGGYEEKTIKVSRSIDPNLLQLNQKGYLNGHTPFSSLVAFITYLVAYLSNKKYIVLSNENSANESTVLGTKINHQYSKTYEFENDFNNYTKKYFKIDIKYFSLLRPFSEFQIAMLFSKYKKYHSYFKSCNVGSKEKNWNWCCTCPKCLFVYIILSPFLYKEELINIFGCDLYEKKELKDTLLELAYYSDTKPFECVGTFEEVRYALSLTIEKHKDNLPYLLKYYKDNYPVKTDIKYEKEFNLENNLDLEFEKIVKEELNKYV